MEIIIKENSIVLNYIKIKKENKNLFKNLLYILSSSENQIDFFIKEELKHLNFNFKNKGTLYLIDCIKISYLNNIYYNYNNNIFPYIERKYSTNSNNIKYNIYYSINNSYYNTSEKIYNNYFQRKITSKPYLNDVVLAVTEHINKKIEGLL